MARVWGIHMPFAVHDDPLENSWVYIGWPRLGNILKIPASREAFKEAVAMAYPEKKAGAIPVDAGTLFRFAHEIQSGDFIVYPSKYNRMVNIGRATGEKGYEADPDNGEDDMPNWLRVEWLGHYPRDEFSQAALNEIGSFITLFAVRNNAGEFLAKAGVEAAQTHKVELVVGLEDTPLPDDTVSESAALIAEGSTADFIIRRLHTGLSGHDFEHFVAHLLVSVARTPR